MEDNLWCIFKKIMQKIFILSIAVLVLALFNVVVTNKSNMKTYDISVFIEGDNANLARVADLSVDYDKNNLELVSSSAGGFFVGSSNLKKDDWEDSRSLQMSTSVDVTKPILRLKFRRINNVPPSIKVSSDSSLYLSQLGSVALPSDGINYKIKYD